MQTMYESSQHWLENDAPDLEALLKALKGLIKCNRPNICPDDLQKTIDLITERAVECGASIESIDELTGELVNSNAPALAESGNIQSLLDYTPLISEVSAEPQELDPEMKRQTFYQLKKQFSVQLQVGGV